MFQIGRIVDKKRISRRGAADVVVLAGDIDTGIDGIRWAPASLLQRDTI
ncbi:MAG: hypothetical protein ABI277_13745 [Burkholderiaceae bacterium]